MAASTVGTWAKPAAIPGSAASRAAQRHLATQAPLSALRPRSGQDPFAEESQHGSCLGFRPLGLGFRLDGTVPLLERYAALKSLGVIGSHGRRLSPPGSNRLPRTDGRGPHEHRRKCGRERQCY